MNFSYKKKKGSTYNQPFLGFFCCLACCRLSTDTLPANIKSSVKFVLLLEQNSDVFMQFSHQLMKYATPNFGRESMYSSNVCVCVCIQNRVVALKWP